MRRACVRCVTNCSRGSTSSTGTSVPKKYLGLFPEMQFVAFFFRDPFQQAVSHYEFLRRMAGFDHPAGEFHDSRMTIEDFVRWDATKEPQAQLLDTLAVEDLDTVGLTEEYPRSVALFNKMFERNLVGDIFANTNRPRAASGYEIGPELRRLIEANRPVDIDIYRRARERFAQQVIRWDV